MRIEKRLRNLTSSVVLSSIIAVPAFSSCESASTTPKPEWLKMDYSIPGHYMSVGIAEKSDKSLEEQRKISENDAKAHLAEEIEVTIESKFEGQTKVINNLVDQFASKNIKVSTIEVLHDLKIKAQWTDKENCTLYTLVSISNESVAHAKAVKLHKNRLEGMKELLDRGSDKETYKEARVRQQYLEDAQLIFSEIDFTLLRETNMNSATSSQFVYSHKITEALSNVRNEITQSKGRTALFAINPDGKIPAEVIEKMLDQLRAENTKADRLMVTCSAASECLDRAKERGFEILTWLKIDGRVETSNMGALKGIVSVSKTNYDITHRNIINQPLNASAHVIGWGNDEVNWASAAEKALQNLH